MLLDAEGVECLESARKSFIMVKMIVALGELGGQDEYSLVEALKQGKINKPVVTWVSGTCARLFKSEVQFGHAGAKSGGEMESAQAKNQALSEAGATVPTSYEAFEASIKVEEGKIAPVKEVKPPLIPEDLDIAIKSGKVRAPTHIISTISDDRGEEPCYAGVPMSSIGLQREKSNRLFRCLDCQYRRELVRVYLMNVEQICPCFVEERTGKLGKLIEDKIR